VSARHIGILRLSAIGDVVMAVPMVRALQQAFPEDKISWLIDKQAYAVVQGLSGVNFIVIDKPKLPHAFFRFGYQMRHHRFDVLLCMQAAFGVNFLYPFLRAKKKIGFDWGRAKDGQWAVVRKRIAPGRDHLVDMFFKFAQAIGVTQQSSDSELPISEADKAYVDTLVGNKPLIAINPRASKEERNWLTERYIALIDAIHQRYDVDVVLTGAPNDKSLTSAIAASSHATDLAGKTNLKQLAALFQRATAVVAPDTGPAHIASAMGTPVIGLYAVAPPELSAPYGSKALVVNKYPEACRQFLDKSPEELPWVTRVHHPGAMGLITVDDVMDKLSLALPA